MTVNSEIRDGLLRHAVWLERYKSGEVVRLIGALNKANRTLLEEIAGVLSSIEARGYNLAPAARKKLDGILARVKEERKDTYAQIRRDNAGALKELAQHEVKYTAEVITSAAAQVEEIRVASPSAERLAAIVNSRPFEGRLLRDWFSGLAAADATRVSAAITNGIVNGRTTDQIVRSLRGTAVQGFEDGILAISRREAANIVRTSVAHVANQARDELLLNNADIILGEQWVATLDSRTCARCAALDGKVFAVGQAPKRPVHFGACRCTTIAYIGDTDTKSTRASQYGPVPASTTYSDWLKTQPASIQDAMLGKSRAKLWREGGLTLDRFTDDTGERYNLQELRARDREVFDSVFAGGTPSNPASRTVREAEFKDYLGPATYSRMKDGVDKAMKASGVPSYGLTEAERIAIHAYTTGDKYYVRLNSALRSGEAEAIARVAPMANVLDKALEKLPTFEGTVLFRVTDLPLDVAKRVKAGNTYADPAFMSASKADLGSSFGETYRFTIVGSDKGKEIAGFSAFRSEQEVLFPRSTKFDILKAQKSAKSQFIEVILSDQAQ